MDVIGKLLGFAVFIAGAVGIYFLLKSKGRMENTGTWAALEQPFRVEQMPTTYTTTSGMIGLGHYRNTLQMAMDATGVFLNLPGLFRSGSKPVHIPYGEFTVSETNPTVNYGFYQYTQFMVRGQSIALDQDDAKKILARKQATR